MRQQCHVDGCEKYVRCWGLCDAHRHHWEKHGEHQDVVDAYKADKIRRRRRPPCSVEGCDGKYYALGLCKNCRARLRDRGTTERWKPAYPDWVTKSGYVMQRRDGKYQLQHRLIMEDHLSRPLWPDETVHHKNGVKTDNRLGNLELWSKGQPAGQRVEDKLAWAREIIARYG